MCAECVCSQCGFRFCPWDLTLPASVGNGKPPWNLVSSWHRLVKGPDLRPGYLWLEVLSELAFLASPLQGERESGEGLSTLGSSGPLTNPEFLIAP